MSRQPPLLRVLALLLVLGLACSGSKEEIEVSFPDEVSRGVTTAVALTAFSPIMAPAVEGEDAIAISCKDIGAFPPTRILDPNAITSLPRLGEVLIDRATTPYPFTGDWLVDVPRAREGDATNPWRATMLYIEARGEARPSTETQTGAVLATLLAGCYCFRSAEGTHPNRVLDQAVKAACAPREEAGSQRRQLGFDSVAEDVFRLETCGVTALTAPRGQPISPGPAVCLATTLCDEASTSGACFDCAQPCNKLDDQSGVPILFTVDQPGGGTRPTTDLVLTDAAGRASSKITVDDCARDIKVFAEILGRPSTKVEFDVDCVDPVVEFARQGDRPWPSAWGEPIAITRFGVETAEAGLPDPGDPPDRLAVLYGGGSSGAIFEVIDLKVAGSRSATVGFAGETARALLGFDYELGGSLRDRGRPGVVVVTSKLLSEGGMTPRETMVTRFFEWGAGGLSLNSGPFILDCGETLCPTAVDCRLEVQAQTEVAVASGDLDGDRRSDIAVGATTQLPITFYYSGQSTQEGAFFAEAGCRCGKFGQAPRYLELLDLGGSLERSTLPLTDLASGGPGGTYVRYAMNPMGGPGSDPLTCGQAASLGPLRPVRDLGKGVFGTEGYEDLVLVSSRSLAAGSADDLGTLRVIFGGPNDLSIDDAFFERSGTNTELVPQALEGSSRPRDPRSVEVADFNGDRKDDVAVLFGASEEVHVWLGAENRGLGEVRGGISLEAGGAKCTPLRQFAAGDFDGDGASDIAVVCRAARQIRWYSATIGK